MNDPRKPVLAGDDLGAALNVPDGVALTFPDVGLDGPPAVERRSRNRSFLVPVELTSKGRPSVGATLHVQPLAGRSADELARRWQLERSWEEHEGSWGRATGVHPPLLYCRERRVLIGAVCADCDPGAAETESGRRCARCGSPREAPDAGPEKLVDRLALRLGRAKVSDRIPWLPCAGCPERRVCYGETRPPEPTAAAEERLVAVIDVPWIGRLVDGADLPFGAWLRLSAGTPWDQVRADLSSVPESHLRRLDALFVARRPTLLGRHPGEAGGLEALLLRLDLLAQLLRALKARATACDLAHLGLDPEGLSIALGEGPDWLPALWTTRLRLLDLTRASVGAGGTELEPPSDRAREMVPAACRPTTWIRGRCLPRTTPATFKGIATWDFHFLRNEPSSETPPRGTLVKFAADGGAGTPRGPMIDGKVDIGFKEVWMVRVDDPGRHDAELRALLGTEDGRPLTVMCTPRDHRLADDLFAAGMLWLSSLTSFEQGVSTGGVLRESLLKAADPHGRRAEAVRGLSIMKFGLPSDVLEAVLDLGLRLCGGVPRAWPGQEHDPVSREQWIDVLAAFERHTASLLRQVRDRLVGFSADDAELRDALLSLRSVV